MTARQMIDALQAMIDDAPTDLVGEMPVLIAGAKPELVVTLERGYAGFENGDPDKPVALCAEVAHDPDVRNGACIWIY